MASGEAGLHDILLTKAGEFTSDRPRYGGPKAEFGYLWDWLNQDAKSAAFEPVRSTFFHYLVQNHPVGPGDQLLGKTVTKRLCHSMRTAAMEHNIHPRTVRNLLCASGMLPDDHLNTTNHDLIVPADAADNILGRVALALNLTQLREQYNIPRPVDEILMQQGHLTSMFAPYDQQKGVGIYFERSDVDAFFDKLFDGAIPVSELTSDYATINKAAKRANCSINEILKLILSKKLNWVGR